LNAQQDRGREWIYKRTKRDIGGLGRHKKWTIAEEGKRRSIHGMQEQSRNMTKGA
jgi:hypothetical protein